ncbi:MAG TPA: PQQ-binding-like beta-propeller repeat protein [Polyangiaceae bacterium]|jgi:polyvinyl alcohol dehydrogenase (cytochrome)|nr:PQQ-binding-like beta-propeller repeat protein [Polyangiaceae bacterium]
MTTFMDRKARRMASFLWPVAFTAVACSSGKNSGHTGVRPADAGLPNGGGTSAGGVAAGTAGVAGSMNAGGSPATGGAGNAGNAPGSGGTTGSAGATNTSTGGATSTAGATGGSAVWPSMGGDLASTYNNPKETLISVATASKLAQAWTLDTSGAPTGTPAVVGNDVYVTASSMTYLVDAKTGATKWTANVGATSSPAYADGLLYVHDGTSNLHALDAATGVEKWVQKTNPHANAWGFSSPIVAGNLVIVGTSGSEEEATGNAPTFRGSVVALDAKSGAMKWTFYTVDEMHNGATIWSSPTADLEADMVFVSTGNNYSGDATDTSDAIIALKLDTGDVLWKHQVMMDDVWSNYLTSMPPDTIDHDFGANPTLFEATIGGTPTKLVGAGTKGGVFYALNRMTGDLVWSKQVGPPTVLRGGMLNNGAFDGKHILVASNTGTSASPGSEPLVSGIASVTSRLAALDPATGDIVWDRQLGAAVWAPISVAGGVGFVSSENRFEAFDTSTGTRLIQLPVAGTVVSAAVGIDGYVYLGSGMVYFTGVPATKFYAFKLN